MDSDVIETFKLFDLHPSDIVLLRRNQIDEIIKYIMYVLLEVYKPDYVFKEQIYQILCLNIEGFRHTFVPTNWTVSSNYIKELQLKPQPEQRTHEWFEFRKDRLTASTDIPTVLGCNKYEKNTDKVMKKKCGIEQPYFTSIACMHGTRMEMVAQMLYEKKNNVNIIEFGCLAHPKYKFIGASPDGITNTGVMLEIKNPYSRKIVGVPNQQYFVQMQIQLEVCDLEICDFLECAYNFYESYDELLTIEEKKTHGYNNIGVYIEVYTVDDRDHPKCRYCPLGLSPAELHVWVEKNSKDIRETSQLIREPRIEWWALKKYSVYRVYRNKEWFEKSFNKLDVFWKKVLVNRKTKTFTNEKKKSKVTKCKLLIDDEDKSHASTNKNKNTNGNKRIVLSL